MASIKVLIADDSVVYRTQIRSAISAYSWLEVIGTASNGKLTIERLKQTTVDLLILDLEMPEMDGLQTLTEIARLGISVKALVFSSASKRGADITLEALRIGAKDFVTKPGNVGENLVQQAGAGPADTIRALLEPKLRAFYPERFSTNGAVQDASKVAAKTVTYPKILWDVFRPKVVLIGSSTGGPTALEKIFSNLGTQLTVPVLIAQHMPPIFTASLAERLSKLSGNRCKEGVHGEEIKPGCIYIAPGDYHMTLEGTELKATIKLDQGPPVNSVRPAVDPMFASAARIYKQRCLSFVLTGMGHDGKAGAQAIKEAGGAVLIQDRESSVVYGMPGAVLDSGAYDKVLSLEEITGIIQNKVGAAPFSVPRGEVKNA